MTTTRRSNPVSRPVSEKTPRGGAGCLIALGVGLIVIVLVGAVLVLLPSSPLRTLLTSDFTTLDATTHSLSVGPLTLRRDSFAAGHTLAVKLSVIPQAAFVGSAATMTALPGGDQLQAQAQAAIPAQLTLASAVYQIETHGDERAVSLLWDESANPIPLELYGYHQSTQRWTFLPSIAQAAALHTATFTDQTTDQALPDQVALFKVVPLAPLISVTLDPGQTMTDPIAAIANTVQPAGLQPTRDGTLQGALPAGVETNKRYGVIPLIRNFADPVAPDVSTLSALLQDAALRDAHIARLVEFATSKPYRGLAIDYRGLPTALDQPLIDFTEALAEHLHNANLTLTVLFAASDFDPAKNADNTALLNRWQKMGAAADFVQVILPIDPHVFAPGGLYDTLIPPLTAAVNRAKVQIGLATLSVQQVGQNFAPISYQDAVAPLGGLAIQQVGAVQPGQPISVMLTLGSARFDQADPSGAPSITYFEASGAVSRVIWLIGANALQWRLNRLKADNLGGVLLTDSAASGTAADALASVRAFASTAPGSAINAAPNPLAIHWTAQQGAISVTAVSAPGTPFVYKPDGSADHVQIAADLFGLDALNGGGTLNAPLPTLGSVQIAVASVTPTPTITPTPSPTPTLPPTATSIPSATSLAATPKDALPPPVGGHVGGGFELGGQVLDLNSGTQSAMRRAGMKWVKQQVQEGDSNGAQLVAQAHAAGFKILLSVVGNKDAILQGGYFDQYAGYVGGLAASGADGLEIWNEMNLDREWPTGKIDPALYTQLLAKAYNAIKSAHGSTLVISGALAPTGAEGAFGLGRVWNDDHYYAGMAAAGAANYADCIGAHYNEGIVSPAQTNGDPRDNYPTRYFGSMLSRAASPFGSKPICFTELGYLSPAGYSPAPAGFEWAQNTTVAEQATWLAQAAVRASNSGRVRLLIVFNVDFTSYGADPQAGYAMLRPGGSCPACDALGSVAR